MRNVIAPIPGAIGSSAGGAVGLDGSTIYRFSDTQWFAWSFDVDVVRAPIAGDSDERTLWTGHTFPRMTDLTIMGPFVGPGIPVARRLGIPAPADAPDAAAQDFTVETSRVTEVAAIGDIPAAPQIGDYLRFTAAVMGLMGFFDTDGASAVTDAAAGDWFRRTATQWRKLAAAPTSEDTAANKVFHAWVYTYVSDKAEEGPPSPPSAIVERGYDASGAIQPVEVSNLATGPAGPYGIALKRLYRTVTGEGGVTSYQLLAEIAVTQVSYTDTALASAVSGALITSQWDPPPDELEGLTDLGNGVLAGFVGRDIYFSEPYQPHAWPRDYIQVVAYDVVGMGAYGTTLVVGTKGHPYVFTGTHPGNMAQARLELDQACVSKRSFVRAGQQGILYASPDGLVLVGPGGARLITRELYSLRDWRALEPENLVGAYLDGQYLGFLENDTIVINPENLGEVRLPDDVKASYSDLESDRLWLVTGSEIQQWSALPVTGVAFRTWRWRSRLELGRLRTFSAAQVIANAYPVILRLFGNGQQVAEITVMNADGFRLPPMGLRSEWQYELEGNVEVTEVRIGAMRDMLS